MWLPDLVSKYDNKIKIVFSMQGAVGVHFMMIKLTRVTSFCNKYVKLANEFII